MTLSKAAQAAKAAAKAQNQTYPIIGHSIWWEIGETEMSQAELEEAVDASIGREFMKDMPSMQRALRIALDAATQAGLITRIPSDDDDIIAYTVHDEEFDRKNVDLNLKKQQTILFHKKENRLEIRKDYKRQEIMDAVAKYQTIFTAHDIRGMTLKYIKANGGVTMRAKSGGIYFVPQTEVRDKLKAFIEHTYTKGSFYSFGVPNTDADKATAHAVVKDELLRDVELAAEDLKQLLAKETDRTKTDSFETRLERFNTLTAKNELYKGLLLGDAEEINKKLNDLKDEVRKALMGEIKEFPHQKDFPYKSQVVYDGKARDKWGTKGTVAGYCFWTDSKSTEKPYVKVLFEKINAVKMVSITQLKNV